MIRTRLRAAWRVLTATPGAQHAATVYLPPPVSDGCTTTHWDTRVTYLDLGMHIHERVSIVVDDYGRARLDWRPDDAGGYDAASLDALAGILSAAAAHIRPMEAAVAAANRIVNAYALTHGEPS